MGYTEVNPGDLREMARLLDQIQGDYASLSRRLYYNMPSMPPWVAGRVHAEIDQASWTLTRKGNELPPVRDDLHRRAAWAEIVSSFSVAPNIRTGHSEPFSVRKAIDLWRHVRVSGSGRLANVASRHTTTTRLVSTAIASAPLVFRASKEAKRVIKDGQFVWKVERNWGKYQHDVSKLAPVLGMAPKEGFIDSMKAARFSFLNVVKAGTDSAKFGGHVAEHHYGDAAWDAWHVSLDIASKNPEVAWVLAGYAFGNQIGTAIDGKFHVSEASSQAIHDDAISSLYNGKTESQLTVKEATKYAQRYDGISGAGHFAKDFAGTSLKSAARFLRGH